MISLSRNQRSLLGAMGASESALFQKLGVWVKPHWQTVRGRDVRVFVCPGEAFGMSFRGQQLPGSFLGTPVTAKNLLRMPEPMHPCYLRMCSLKHRRKKGRHSPILILPHNFEMISSSFFGRRFFGGWCVCVCVCVRSISMEAFTGLSGHTKPCKGKSR